MGTSTSSRLQDLPPELRNRIFTALFDSTTVVIGIPDLELQRPSLSTPAPSILLMCRRTYHEAVGIYYNTTTFTAMRSSGLTDWLKALPNEHICTLGDVRYDSHLICEASWRSIYNETIPAHQHETLAKWVEDILANVINKQLESHNLEQLRGKIKASIVDAAGSTVWTTMPMRTFETMRPLEAAEAGTLGSA